VQAEAIETLREAGREGERVARAAFDALPFEHKSFQTLTAPVWRAMAIECRLADLVVFGASAARGEGPFAEMFELVLMEERAATFVARTGGADAVLNTALVAWDGGEPASRAARRAVPLLRLAKRVVITGSPPADRGCSLDQLQAYYALRGIKAELKPLSKSADMAPVLLEAAAEAQADLMVAGAFGRSRLREFIFGGTTRALLHAERPSLFVAH
jgi:nucleotide-binding universal stress UspA family protein